MNDSNPPGTPAADADREQELSALFVQLVMQQANMAMMLLGKVPHPESGQVLRDLDAAKLFIDQLEMLQTKTKGNLSRHESALLQQSLTTLRLGFVEAVDASPPPLVHQKPPQAGSPPTAQRPNPAGPEPSTPPAPEEHPKKFTKKY
jgi:Domain of unknown function (DUF1844)